MKALTVQQPWAWAIMHAGKVENRTTHIAGDYRGPVAIHAGLSYDVTAYAMPWPPGTTHADPDKRIRGAIIGTADMVDVHVASEDCVLDGPCGPWGWYVIETPRGPRQAVHHVFDNQLPLSDPVPCRGFLGLWSLDRVPGLRDRLARALLDDAEREAIRA